MKNLTRILAALPLVGIAACNTPEILEPAEAPSSITVHFKSGPLPSKTAFSASEAGADGQTVYPTRWTGNSETVGISLNYEEQVSATVTPTDNGLRADFTAEYDYSVEGEYEDFTFYVVSPASAFTRPSPSREALTVNIPVDQTPLAASVDEAAQILVAASATTAAITQEVDVHFSHLTAYGRLSLTNLSLAEGVTVQSVYLTAGAPIAGNFYYNVADGSLDGRDASYTVQLATSATSDIWFACAPADLSGTSLRVMLNLSDGTGLARTVDLTGKTLSFVSGQISKFSVNMAGAEEITYTSTTTEEVYELVTSLSSLSNGDEVVVVNDLSAPTYAMTSSTSGTTGLAAVAGGTDSATGFIYTASDGYIRLSSNTTAAVWTVANKTTSGNSTTMQLKNGSNYLYSNRSGQSRVLTVGTTYTSWAVSIASSGQASLYVQGNRNNYYVTLNSGNFVLSSSTSYCRLYKKTTVTNTGDLDPATADVLRYDQYGAYIQGNPLIYSPTSDQLSREYQEDGTVLFTILDPANESYVEFSGIPSAASYLDTFTLGMKYKSKLVTVLDFSYDVMVVREDAAVLWLSDGTNGFIVKR